MLDAGAAHLENQSLENPSGRAEAKADPAENTTSKRIRERAAACAAPSENQHVAEMQTRYVSPEKDVDVRAKEKKVVECYGKNVMTTTSLAKLQTQLQSARAHFPRRYVSGALDDRDAVDDGPHAVTKRSRYPK